MSLYDADIKYVMGYILLWGMASLVNIHICVPSRRSTKYLWSYKYCGYVISRLMFDILFIRSTIFFDLLCFMILVEVAMLWHLTDSLKFFKHENSLPYVCMLSMGLCADLSLCYYMASNRLRMLAVPEQAL